MMIGQLNLSQYTEILSTAVLSKLVGSLAIILVLVIIKNIIYRIIKKQIKSNRAIYKWQRVTVNIIYGVAVLFLAIIWLTGIKSLTTFIGIITAALAFALKDIVTDLAGYLFVLAKQPFTIGDRIEIKNIKGDVLQFDWFQIPYLKWVIGLIVSKVQVG